MLQSRRLSQLAAVFALLSASGCVPSLNPLYEAGDTTFRQELIGEWREADANSPEGWTFESVDDEAYRLTILGKNPDGSPKEFECVAHLVELDSQLYLDVQRTVDPSLQDVVIVPHFFVRIRLEEEQLYLDLMDLNWVENFVRGNPGAINTAFLEGQLILTAQPTELQEFIIANTDAGLFLPNDVPLLNVAATDGPPDSELAAGLELITIPADELPENVSLIEKIETAALVPVTQNPEVFAEPDRIARIAFHFGITDETQLDALVGAGVALYQDGEPASEIGIYAICFAGAEAAEEYFETITASAADGADVPFVRQGAWLLYAWRDDAGSDAAMQAMLESLRETDE